MKQRFEGDQGKALLISAVMSNQLVEQNEELASLLIQQGTLVSFGPKDNVIEQHGTDNDLYLIVCGEVDIIVNGRLVAVRKVGEPVGEMALINPCAVRSATVKARNDVVALKITEPEFRKISNQFKQLWRPLALIAGERLRERNQFHKSPNEKPRIFIGSSSEGMKIAEAIAEKLPETVITKLWYKEVFGPSSVTIDALLSEVEESDFAIFVFGPDDESTVRGKQHLTPRDNVVFEFGLFMGLLKRERTFMIVDKSKEVKIPSDYNGVTYVPFTVKKTSLLSRWTNSVDHENTLIKEAAEDVCKALMPQIEKEGPK